MNEEKRQPDADLAIKLLEQEKANEDLKSENKALKYKAPRQKSVTKRLKESKLDKTAEELLGFGACTLYLLWGNKMKAYRHSAGCANKDMSGSVYYFNSDKRKEIMKIAEEDFEKTMEGLLQAYAKKKGLFYPSEAALENNSAKFEAIQRGLKDGIRSKDDVLIELNEWLNQATLEPTMRRDIMRLYIEVTNMKKAEEEAADIPSVVILPPKNNITLFGVEMFVAPDKRDQILKEYNNLVNPGRFGTSRNAKERPEQ